MWADRGGATPDRTGAEGAAVSAPRLDYVFTARVGVGGFAAVSGVGPALKLLAHVPIRTVSDYNLSLIPMFVLLGALAFPVIAQLGFDRIWFGVIIVMTVELALISPPVGMNVYVIKGVVPGLGLGTIFRGVLPFLLVDLLRLAILVVFPDLVVFLPRRMG